MGDILKKVNIRRITLDVEQLMIQNLRKASRIRRYDPERRKLIRVKRTKGKLLMFRDFTIYLKPDTHTILLKTCIDSFMITYVTKEALESFLNYINAFLINKDDEGMRVAVDFYCNL